ncbi:nucleotide pyrophosphohydrolase [Candidatus Woesearchaeota archaeon]|nr:nucleotide pyrophosphohydrolase [Candidatus Woesearchaeota archaeon]
MALKEVQQDVDRWARQFKVPYWQPHEILARLAEEQGELAREINHRFGPKRRKLEERDGDLGEEMADIVFTLCCLANSRDVDLDSSWKKVMGKCYGRDQDRYAKK